MELEIQIVAAVVNLEKSYHMTVAEESTDKYVVVTTNWL